MKKLIVFLLSLLLFPLEGFCTNSQGWVEYPSTPVLTYTASWEGTSVQEPSVVILPNNTLLMMYDGFSSGNDSIGFATSTDGYNWTKNPSNPLIGNGNGGVSGSVWHASLFLDTNGTLYTFYCDANTGGNVWKISSTDSGATWSGAIKVIDASQTPFGFLGSTNTNVFRDGKTYYLLDEYGPSNFANRIYVFTSTDLIHWSFISNNPISGIGVGTGFAVGGPDTHFINGNYYFWYHASSGAAALPSNIYFASADNILNLNQSLGAVIDIASEINLSSFPGGTIDQTADPSVVEFNGTTFAYYSRLHNSAPFTSDISLRTYSGTLNKLLNVSTNRSDSVNSSIIKGSLN